MSNRAAGGRGQNKPQVTLSRRVAHQNSQTTAASPSTSKTKSISDSVAEVAPVAVTPEKDEAGRPPRPLFSASLLRAKQKKMMLLLGNTASTETKVHEQDHGSAPEIAEKSLQNDKSYNGTVSKIDSQSMPDDKKETNKKRSVRSSLLSESLKNNAVPVTNIHGTLDTTGIPMAKDSSLRDPDVGWRGSNKSFNKTDKKIHIHGIPSASTLMSNETAHDGRDCVMHELTKATVPCTYTFSTVTCTTPSTVPFQQVKSNAAKKSKPKTDPNQGLVRRSTAQAVKAEGIGKTEGTFLKGVQGKTNKKCLEKILPKANNSGMLPIDSNQNRSENSSIGLGTMNTPNILHINVEKGNHHEQLASSLQHEVVGPAFPMGVHQPGRQSILSHRHLDMVMIDMDGSPRAQRQEEENGERSLEHTDLGEDSSSEKRTTRLGTYTLPTPTSKLRGYYTRGDMSMARSLTTRINTGQKKVIGFRQLQAKGLQSKNREAETLDDMYLEEILATGQKSSQQRGKKKKVPTATLR